MNQQFAHFSEKLSPAPQDLGKIFLSLGLQIANLGDQIGLQIIPTSDDRLPLFNALPVTEQLAAISKMQQSLDIFGSIVREKSSLKNSFSVVWMACTRLGLRPPSDFFDKLSNEDTVQIYSKEGVHRFSNLTFFELCSYTLEQLYSLPWNRLWTRDECQTEFLMSCVEQVLAPDQKATLTFNEASHLVKETDSIFLYELEYRMKFMAPLFDRITGEKNGFLICESGKLLNKRTPLEEERMLYEFQGRRTRDVSGSLF